LHGDVQMKNYIEEHSNAMLNLIGELVNIDSGTYDKDGVDKVGNVLIEEYMKLDFHIDRYSEKMYGDNLVIRHKDAVEPEILIIAHLDTVFSKGTAIKRPFRQENNYAYGPGIIDMKSSHVCTLFALKALIACNSKGYKNIELILNTDEEIGSVCSRRLIEKVASTKKFALIMEPAFSGAVVTARKGGGKYHLKIKGKSAHAGIEPDQGISAIDELGYKILKLHRLTNYSKGIRVHVGLVSGGTSINTIAPYAEASIDLRVETMEQATFIEDEIKRICSKSDVPGTHLELSGTITRPPMIPNSASKSLFSLVQQVAKELGFDLSAEKRGGKSDGNLTAAMGIATVDGLGPVGGKAHTEDEYLYIPSLMERTLLLAKIIDRLSRE